ncbi:major facilitator superfamily domain-containing protein [Neofusicoccum parvum]|uniref:Major facilitator superfamily domain-containing protein n=1 Tax=Neofusicoccum parvum TaxID=310453 RepID=A0ACB5SB11_9PEZI|nr:major facilitator superfamily domain-containing protein [Neofusicoccum parvum]
MPSSEKRLDDMIQQAPTTDDPRLSVQEQGQKASDARLPGDVESSRDPRANASPLLPFSKGRCIALVATLTGASFLNTFAVQAAVIILPTIAEALDIPASRAQWIVSAYLLTFGCFLLLWGRIADLYGKRMVFILGSAWVTVTVAANPFMPNEIAFDVFRGLQGLGGAANVPTAMGILGTTFPPGRAKTYAFSVYSAGAPLGSVIGNLLAGFIASFGSWKWVFGAMAMLAALVTVAGIFVIPQPKEVFHDRDPIAAGTVDWLGAFLITAGLLCLLFALTEGNVVGWSTPWVPVLIVVSIFLVTSFVLWQRHLGRKKTPPPLMRVSVFHSRIFSSAMLTNGLFNASFNGYLVYATYFFQDYQDLTPLQTTLRFIPTGVTGIITAAVASQLLMRIPAYKILLFSTLCVSTSSLLFAVPIPPDTTYFAYGLWAMMFATFGADTVGPCLSLFTSHTLPQADQAMGGALLYAFAQLGRALGLAVATATQTAVMAREKRVSVENAREVEPWDAASLAGLRAANWLNFALGMCSLCVVGVAFRGSGIIGKAGAAK